MNAVDYELKFLPKRYRKRVTGLLLARDEMARTRGFQEGWLRAEKAAETKALADRAKVRLAALGELTKFLSVTGQTIQAVCRSMESEANQL